MTANSKKSRALAEAAFSKTRSLSLGRIMSEQDALNQAREAKTARLRELRLEKEAADLLTAALEPTTKKAKR